MALFVGTRSPGYAVLMWPVGALLVARLVDVSPERVAVGLTGGLIMISIAATGWYTWQQSQSSYHRHVARLQELVPPDATVQADPFLWYGFSDQPFIASHYFVLAESYEENARRLGIDYVILDLPQIGMCAWCTSYSEEVTAFLAEHAELIAELDDPLYGGFIAPDGNGFVSQVYRMDQPMLPLFVGQRLNACRVSGSAHGDSSSSACSRWVNEGPVAHEPARL